MLWAKMRKALGLDAGANVHACRHTFVTRLVQRGVPVNEIQALARHADIRTTMGYMHLHDDRLRGAISVLEAGTLSDEPPTR